MALPWDLAIESGDELIRKLHRRCARRAVVDAERVSKFARRLLPDTLGDLLVQRPVDVETARAVAAE